MPKIAIVILAFEMLSTMAPEALSQGLVASNLSLNLDSGLIVGLKNLLLISSFLSLIIGTIVGLAQTKIKRLLAYSTISHIGFILLALALNSEQSIDSLLFYIIQYTLTNLNVFLILLAFGYIINSKNLINNNLINADINFISQLKGQFFHNPILSLSLSICLFSMAGVPPLIGFFSKYYVLYSAISSQYYLMAIIAILTSVISASYYIKIIRILHTEDNNSKINEIENNELVLNNFHSFLISTLTLSILLFVLKPSILLNSTQLFSLSVYNF